MKNMKHTTASRIQHFSTEHMQTMSYWKRKKQTIKKERRVDIKYGVKIQRLLNKKYLCIKENLGMDKKEKSRESMIKERKKGNREMRK